MSKEKRELQKRNREKAIRKAKLKKSLTVGGVALVGVAIVGGIAAVIIYNNAFFTKANSDFSAGLNSDGTIQNVRAMDYVTLCDYKNMTVSESELYPSELETQAHINSLLSQYQSLSEEPVVVKNGDKINLDYVGTIDGEEFQGGSTNGMGTQLIVGSGSYIPGFEDQIAGRKVGESFDIKVTFPDEYRANPDLASKEAVFAITINGIYALPEWNDEFVAENLSSQALTADAYEKNYRQQRYQEKLSSFVASYVKENTVINEYPEEYMKKVMGNIKYWDQKNYQNYKQNYSYSGTFDEYTGMSKKEYEANIRTQAESRVDNFLLVQSIYEDAGLTVSQDDVSKSLEALGADISFYKQQEEIYGKGYLYQAAMAYTVQNYLEEVVQVTK